MVTAKIKNKTPIVDLISIIEHSNSYEELLEFKRSIISLFNSDLRYTAFERQTVMNTVKEISKILP